MWNFEGNTKSRSKINLGGRVASTSKQELLQKTREERRRREEERHRNTCASKIQKVVQRYLEKTKLFDSQRVEYDQSVSKHTSLNSEDLDTLICKLVLFFDPIKDNKRLENLLSFAQETLDSSVPRIFSLLNTPISVFRWSCLISQFLRLSLKLTDFCPVSLGMIKISTDYAHFNIISDKDTREATYKYILSRLVDNNIFAVISNSMKNIEDRETILSLTRKLLDPSVASPSIYRAYVIQQWTSLILSEFIRSENLSLFFQALPFANIVKATRSLVDEPCLLSVERIHFLLSNLTEVRRAITRNLIAPFLEDYFYAVRGIVIWITKKEEPKEKDTSSEEELVDLTGTYDSIDSIIPLELLGSTLDSINHADNTVLPFLVDSITHILIQWPNLKSETLAFLLHRVRPSLYRSIIPLLYDYVEASPLISWLEASNQDWVMKLNSKKDELDYNRWCQDWSVFYILLLLMQRQLEVLGERSMVDESGQKFLDLNQIQRLLGIMSGCLFGLYENTSKIDMSSLAGGVAPFSLLQFRNVATNLLRQIHDKNSRKSFLPKEVWLETWSKLRQPGFAGLASKELFTLHLRSQEDEDHEDHVEEISPRVAILRHIPFIVPFDIRVEIFSQIISLEKLRHEESSPFSFSRFNPQPVTIRRASVFQDGFEQLNGQGTGLKGRISISLVNQLGMPEAGIDGGGVFKEFLNELIHQAFAPPAGLFLATADQSLYPNPQRRARILPQLRYYGFLGRMVGKALFEGILIDTTFARFFLAKLLGRPCYLDDLPSLDPELYQGLMVLQQYEGNVEKDFDLNFTITDLDSDTNFTVELGRGGEKRAVTTHSRFEYIRRVADYRLNVQLQRQSDAFSDGLSDLIPGQWLRLFDPTELQMVISGGVQPIDVSDLERHTTYSGVYGADHATIQAFWKVVRELDNTALGLLVKFITSCARPPLQGFGALSPPLCIRDAGRDDERLPTASTCVNLLKLPNYSSPRILKEKLLYAIHSESGFELS